MSVASCRPGPAGRFPACRAWATSIGARSSRASTVSATMARSLSSTRTGGSKAATTASSAASCLPATYLCRSSNDRPAFGSTTTTSPGRNFMPLKSLKILPLLAGAAVLASAFSAAAKDTYTIGVSNTVQGNGWREEMICAIKAQALASGEVAKLNIAHRNTDAAGQLEDIRNLISAKVNAIVVNPADPAGIKAALEEATKAGIVVVAVDQTVTEPTAYIISNNQEEYAY